MTITMSEFIANLFLHSLDTPEPMTVEDAAYDLGNFIADGIDIPEGITAESYAEAWNTAVEEDRTNYTYGEG